MADLTLEDVLKEFPPGPLDFYRKQATFKWQDMRILVEGEDGLLLKHKIWKVLENEPLFAHTKGLSHKEYRHLTYQRMKKIDEYDFFSLAKMFRKPHLGDSFLIALGNYDWSPIVKYSLLHSFEASTILGLGTEIHMGEVQRLVRREIGACFCLTEIGHGTNTKAMRTTATFNVEKQQYILHTPDFEAAKCWSGNLGQTATHAVVFASLYTPDGQDHGLHAFFIQIRDENTFETLYGVTVGDMGPKIGLDGVDNGFMMFDQFYVPKSALLNRTGDVDELGKYISPFKDKKKRLGASLGNLSAGRVGIVGMATANLIKAVVIAVRYSGVRRQFGPENSTEELPVLEYQLQQWRLFPFLAAGYVLSNFSKTFRGDFISMQTQQMAKKDPERLAAVGAEIHAVSSSAKPLAGWLARDGIQECREACGGHGYLAASGFGDLRNDNDANCTYEGDNNVLLQQSANWLLNLWALASRGGDVQSLSPLGSAAFLQRGQDILRSKCAVKAADQWLHMPALLDAYEWLICHLLVSTSAKLEHLQSSGQDPFTAKNNSQAFHYRPLSIAYIEATVLRRFITLCSDPQLAPPIASVLKQLGALYGAFSLLKHASVLFEGGYFSSDCSIGLRKVIEELCVAIKPNAIALVDALAPADFALNSVLANSDGNVYRHMEADFTKEPDWNQRPSWWRSIVEKPKSNL